MPAPPAASGWTCCFGCCCHGASGLSHVRSTRTTARLLPDSCCGAVFKVFAVRLAVLLRESWRVSAVCRRGAAAYGVAFRHLEEVKTHVYLLS